MLGQVAAASVQQALGLRRPTASTGSRTERACVSVDNAGYLYGSAQIFLFVLAIGAFISVTMKTGAIQGGIGRLALRFSHSRRRSDRSCLMSVFALGGTTEGMWEETLGFFALLVPLALALGFDRIDRRRDHLPRRRHRSARLDREPVRHRGRLRCRRDRGRRWHRPAPGRCWSSSSRWRSRFVLRYAYRVRRDQTKSVLGSGRRASAGMRMADEAGRRRRAADGPPEGHPGPVLRGLRGDDLRLHPLERHLGHDLRRRLPAADVQRPSTSPRRRCCSSSWRW